MDSPEIEEKNKKRPLSKDEIEIFKTFIEFTRGSMSTLIALTATGGLLIRLGSPGGDKPPHISYASYVTCVNCNYFSCSCLSQNE